MLKFFQLLSQKFTPHRKSGYCPLPLNDDPLYLAASIGIKIAVGFQILFSEKSKKETDSNDDMEESGHFQKFLHNLKQYDYFEGEMENSKRWKILYRNAKSFFWNINRGNANNQSHRKNTSQGTFSKKKTFPKYFAIFFQNKNI